MTLALALKQVPFASVTETHRGETCGTSGTGLQAPPAMAYYLVWL